MRHDNRRKEHVTPDGRNNIQSSPAEARTLFEHAPRSPLLRRTNSIAMHPHEMIYHLVLARKSPSTLPLASVASIDWAPKARIAHVVFGGVVPSQLVASTEGCAVAGCDVANVPAESVWRSLWRHAIHGLLVHGSVEVMRLFELRDAGRGCGVARELVRYGALEWIEGCSSLVKLRWA